MKTKQIKSAIGLFFFGLSAFQLQGQALLWEISGNGLSEKSYLFGSIHIQDKRVFQFDSAVWNRFEKSSNLALEFDIGSVNSLEVAERMMMSQSYRELLSEEDYQLLLSVAEDHLDIPFFLIDRMKPFFVLVMFTLSYISEADPDGYEEEPMDMYFLRKAREAQKNILELESFDEQMNIIDRMFDEQLKALIKFIRNPNLQTDLITEYENLITAYLSQDDTKLYELILESSDSDTFMKYFLNERNHNMLKKIRTFVANGSTFIVVGAGHLAGEEGLVNLLKNDGYTLTPIKFNEE